LNIEDSLILNNFLILGLPRSRTGWLANFLTYGDITCSHEGLNKCTTLPEYVSKFTLNSGDSNTGLALFDFEPYFPDAKIIIIENSIDAAVSYSKKYYQNDSTELMVKARKRLSEIDGLHIPFDGINNNLETIWDYVSSYQFNEKRAEMLTTFDIQIRDPYLMDMGSIRTLIKNTKNYF